MNYKVNDGGGGDMSNEKNQMMMAT